MSRAKRRRARRARNRQWHTELKLSLYQIPVAIGRITRSRALECAVVHRTQFNGHPLMFIGFGLSISMEGPLVGYGLMANLAIPALSPITQYEGILIPKARAEAVRKGVNGMILGSHFATTSVRQMVINGFSYQPNALSSTIAGGVRLDIDKWHGRGGGSICNHETDNPNAELVRDSSGDGYGIFVCSLRRIAAGEFIHVDYGKMFVNSSKSNI